MLLLALSYNTYQKPPAQLSKHLDEMIRSTKYIPSKIFNRQVTDNMLTNDNILRIWMIRSTKYIPLKIFIRQVTDIMLTNDNRLRICLNSYWKPTKRRKNTPEKKIFKKDF